MSESAMSCPKCQGEMVQGFVLDCSHGAILISQWVKGPAQKARAAFGILPTPGIDYPKAEEMIPIGTFRCQSCGFLESYAREEFAVN